MPKDLDKVEPSRFGQIQRWLRAKLTADRANAYLNAVAGEIPIIGAIAQIIDYECSARPSAENQVRLEQRLTEVAELVLGLDVQVKAEYVRTEEFTDLWLGVRSVWQRSARSHKVNAARNLLLHNLAASDVRSFEQLDEQVLHVVESLSSLHIAALVFLATHDRIGIVDEGMKLVDKGTHSVELHLEHEHGHGLFAALDALGLAQKWPPPGPAGGAHNTNTRRITSWGSVVAQRISDPSWTAATAE